MGDFTFKKGYDYIVKVFALYHGLSKEETDEYFTRSGLIPFLSEYYGGLCYTPSLEMIQWIRFKLEEQGATLPKQIYKGYMYADGITPTPPY